MNTAFRLIALLGVIVAVSACTGADDSSQGGVSSSTSSSSSSTSSSSTSSSSTGSSGNSQNPEQNQSVSKLNDTGLSYSGNHPRTVNETCLMGVVDLNDEWTKESFDNLNFNGQDCEQGRDVLYPDNSDGHAGFSFTKVSADGSALPVDAIDWQCVIDNVSGLMWEVKQAADGIVGNAGLHDADDLFTWYDTDASRNAGFAGSWNQDGDNCHGYQNGQPESFCNSQSYIDRVNKAGLCGFRDWRLPSFGEYTNLVNFDVVEPAIDKVFFPSTQIIPYWSSSAVALAGEYAYALHFKYGFSDKVKKTEMHAIRLVRDVGRKQ